MSHHVSTILDDITVTGVITASSLVGALNVSNLPVGSNGEVLTTVAGVATWTAPSSGIIVSDDITPGTENQIMRVVGGVTTWADNIVIGNIPNNSIPNNKMAANSIDSINLINESVISNKLGPDSVTSGKILNNAVTPIKIEPSAINGEVMRTIAGVCEWSPVPSVLPISTSDITPGTENQIMRVVGGVNTWQSTIDVSNIPADSVDSINLRTASVITSKIANNSVTNDKIEDLSITATKIANNSIITRTIANANVTPAKLGPSLTNGDVLTTVAGAAAWAAPAGGFSPLMCIVTTAGGIITNDAITNFGTVVNQLGVTSSGGKITNFPAGRYIITFSGQLTLGVGHEARTNLINLVDSTENILNTFYSQRSSNEYSVYLTAYINNPTEIYIRARDVVGTPSYGRSYLYVNQFS